MNHIHTRRITVALAAGAAGIMVAATTGCSGPPDARPAADRLAAALQSGDFADIAWTGGTTSADVATAVEELTGGMDGAPREVRVSGVQDDGDDRREVELDIGWDLGTSDTAWSYTTQAELTLDGDQWRAVWEPSIVHPDLVAGARLDTSRQQAERGDVLGAEGEVVVTERPVYRIGIDKTRIDAAAVEGAARELAGVLDVDADGLAERAGSAGPKAFVEAITFREGDAEPVLAEVEAIDGAVALPDTLALAPTRDFARPILGTVGDATAEIVDESGGMVQAGDVVGLSGLQRQYDERLRGTPGVTVQVVPAEGEPTVVYEAPPSPGGPVRTTLDVELQERAEEIVGEVGPPAAIVAVQPSTGAVLAAASGPGGEGYSTATLGQYAPGSTFKIVTALALLRAGSTPESTVRCDSTVTVDGKDFENYDDYPAEGVGDISLRAAIANSCNTALIDQRDSVTQAQLAEAAAALGLNAGHDTGVPAFLGDVPAQAGATGHAAAMIGQGEVLASPLSMATVAASVAAGRTVTPTLVERDDAADAAGSEAGTLRPAEAQTLQDLMRAVVEEGSASFLAEVPGEPVGAKTGTAEYGSDDPPRTHAWMVATQGDLAVAVFVEDGESGSQTAGPLLEEFLRAG